MNTGEAAKGSMWRWVVGGREQLFSAAVSSQIVSAASCSPTLIDDLLAGLYLYKCHGQDEFRVSGTIAGGT